MGVQGGEGTGKGLNTRKGESPSWEALGIAGEKKVSPFGGEKIGEAL